MKNYWVSWYADEDVAFTLNTPWWCTGWRCADGAATVCAAVKAMNEYDAKDVIVAAHDDLVSLEWRFVNERPDEWSPFCDRFPRADWMVWE
jgi:hypothetical protein